MTEDVVVPPGPGAPDGLRIPGAELSEQFSHAGGPGGQGVNTADSRVQLSLDLASTSALTETQRVRVMSRLGPRLSGTVLTITAAEERSQRRNRALARQRLADLLRGAVTPEIARRATKPTQGSKRRRLEQKRQRSEIKQQRQRPSS